SIRYAQRRTPTLTRFPLRCLAERIHRCTKIAAVTRCLHCLLHWPFRTLPHSPVSTTGHIPVLLHETLQLLSPKPGETAVDCTTGRGGHSMALAQAVKPDGQVIGFDLDPENLAYTHKRIANTGVRFIPVHANFARVAEQLAAMRAHADVVLADLGFSSTQMDDPQRGLSFSVDGPLDMRLDPSGPVTAADLLATLSEKELADLIYHYGEDPFARKIARKLVQNRR